MILAKWFGTARWTYNRCLDAVEKEKVKRTKKALRAKCLNANNFVDSALKWVIDTPYDIRNQAMSDLLKAFKTCFAKGDKFQMKYRSRKDKQQSIVIESKHWGRKKGEVAFLTNIKASEPLPTKLGYDSRL